MSAIDREFNLSKTMFMLAPQNPVHGIPVRIFRPDGEIPFAGHSTIGAAVSLALRQKQQMGLLVTFTIEEEIGLLRCVVNPGEKAPFVEFDLPKLLVLNPLPFESEIFATAFCIENSAIGLEKHVPGL